MPEEHDRNHINGPAEEESYRYTAEFWQDPDPANLCPDCQGKGKVLLLVSTVCCQTCGGRGFLGEARIKSWTAVTRFDDPQDGEGLSSYRAIPA